MTRWLLAAIATALFACSSNDVPVAAKALAAAPAKPVPVASVEAAPKSGEPPAQIVFPSSVGDVTFNHEMHFKDLGAKCVDCHHPNEAKTLTSPHAGYLESSPVNCKGCHDAAGKAKAATYSCSGCHKASPANIADETLSSKVVIHTQCWKCHSMETGKAASAGCAKCHSGKQA